MIFGANRRVWSCPIVVDVVAGADGQSAGSSYVAPGMSQVKPGVSYRIVTLSRRPSASCYLIVLQYYSTVTNVYAKRREIFQIKLRGNGIRPPTNRNRRCANALRAEKNAAAGERIVFAWMRMPSAPVRIVFAGVRILFARM